MLDWFKGLFKTPELPEASIAEQAEKAASHQVYIEKILYNLISSRTLLNLKFPSAEQNFSSLLLEINRRDDFIIIDEIAPSEGNQIARRGLPFTITTREHGVALSFNTRVLRHVEGDGDSYYILPYPSEIHYQQRRKSYRVPIYSENILRADIFLPNHPRMAAKVSDISVSGLRLYVRYNVLDTIENLKYIDQCLLITPFAKSTTFSLEIRHSFYDMANKCTVLCCEFMDISADKQLFLIELVGKLQHQQVMNKFKQK